MSASPLDVRIDPRPAPEICQSMAEVRQGVDALDRALVRLMAERQRYMEAAARIKKARAAVRDEARIADVLEKVEAQARREGLSVVIAERVWRALIEACIAHELDAFERNRAQSPDRMA